MATLRRRRHAAGGAFTQPPRTVSRRAGTPRAHRWPGGPRRGVWGGQVARTSPTERRPARKPMGSVHDDRRAELSSLSGNFTAQLCHLGNAMNRRAISICWRLASSLPQEIPGRPFITEAGRMSTGNGPLASMVLTVPAPASATYSTAPPRLRRGNTAETPGGAQSVEVGFAAQSDGSFAPLFSGTWSTDRPVAATVDAAIATGGVTTTPEPATLPLLATAIGCFGRRRCNKTAPLPGPGHDHRAIGNLIQAFELAGSCGAPTVQHPPETVSAARNQPQRCRPVTAETTSPGETKCS